MKLEYREEIRNTTNSDIFATSTGVLVSADSPVARGELRREVFLDIAGRTIEDLRASPKFKANGPDAQDIISTFEIPSNQDDDYACRITGWIVPPESGEYVFYVASDDDSELQLSEDDSATKLKTIVQVSRATRSRAWSSSGLECRSERPCPTPLNDGSSWPARLADLFLESSQKLARKTIALGSTYRQDKRAAHGSQLSDAAHHVGAAEIPLTYFERKES